MFDLVLVLLQKHANSGATACRLPTSSGYRMVPISFYEHGHINISIQINIKKKNLAADSHLILTCFFADCTVHTIKSKHNKGIQIHDDTHNSPQEI